MTISIQSMHGMGDNIFIRPFVRAEQDRQPVFLTTPWPELFEDLPNVKFVPLKSSLRTQAKNVQRQSSGRWQSPPVGTPVKALRYAPVELMVSKTITKALERQLPLRGAPYIFDLPVRSPVRKPVAVIRPVTTRKEWTNTARNPLPEYVNAIAKTLMATHKVVVVADIAPTLEWIEGTMPPGHAHFVKGELNIKDLMELVSSADIVVGGIGWLVPMAIAANTNAFFICGGQGAHNAPEVITDLRMDLSRVYFAKPDNYCNCSNMRHPCNKTISNLADQWNTFTSHVATRCSTYSPLAV